MPFNVCDKEGRHIGFLYSTEIFQEETDVVALSNKKIQQLHCNYKDLLLNVAWVLDAKTLLGKINEDKLNEKLWGYWQDNKEFLGDFDKEFIIKAICVHKIHIKLKDYYIVDKGDILGYLLFDKSKVEFYDKETIIIKEDLEYISDEIKIEDKLPIYAKIIDYPIVKTDEMGIPGALASTQIHSTKLKLQSGNLVKSVTLPATIITRKGMTIEMYVTEKKGIKAAFCDGIIYSFC